MGRNSSEENVQQRHQRKTEKSKEARIQLITETLWSRVGWVKITLTLCGVPSGRGSGGEKRT